MENGDQIYDFRLVSLIIPLYNEEESLPALFEALRRVLGNHASKFEIVIIDDGSEDGTNRLVTDELRHFPHWQVVSFSRNFGQQAAYRAGLEAAKGEAAIFLDADLQDPPELIPELAAKWKKGFFVVTAVRTSRSERGLRRLGLDGFHFIFDKLTNGIMPANSGMFALIDRKVIDHLCNAREVNLYLPAMKNWFGYSQATVSYDRRSRAIGEPKQSLGKLLNDALNAITSYSEKPLQWIALFGVLVSILSCAYALVLLGIKVAQVMGYFHDWNVMGFTTLAVAIFLLGGIQLTCLGIVGQYLARIYREVKGRPIYVVAKKTASDEQ